MKEPIASVEVAIHSIEEARIRWLSQSEVGHHPLKKSTKMWMPSVHETYPKIPPAIVLS
jgi:hypothetical protein